MYYLDTSIPVKVTLDLELIPGTSSMRHKYILNRTKKNSGMTDYITLQVMHQTLHPFLNSHSRAISS